MIICKNDIEIDSIKEKLKNGTDFDISSKDLAKDLRGLAELLETKGANIVVTDKFYYLYNQIRQVVFNEEKNRFEVIIG